MAPTVFQPTDARSLNLRAGFGLRRQLSNQPCPTKSCLALAESTAACPRDNQSWIVRQTQMGFNRHVALTAPILCSATSIARNHYSASRPQPRF